MNPVRLRFIGGAELGGRSLDEFLALPYRGYVSDLSLADILSAKTAEQFRQFDEEVIRTGQRVLHAVMHFETQDSRSRLVRVVHERIKGGGGLPNGLLTVFDVQKLKQRKAQDALITSIAASSSALRGSVRGAPAR